jgi:hypothetical protein
LWVLVLGGVCGVWWVLVVFVVVVVVVVEVEEEEEEEETVVQGGRWVVERRKLKLRARRPGTHTGRGRGGMDKDRHQR